MAFGHLEICEPCGISAGYVRFEEFIDPITSTAIIARCKLDFTFDSTSIKGIDLGRHPPRAIVDIPIREEGRGEDI